MKLRYFKFDSEEEAREFINKDKLEVVSIYLQSGDKKLEQYVVVWYYE
jgi:hypothetical protein